MSTIATWSIIVSAVASAVIAWHAIASHVLAKRIKSEADRREQEQRDLYQALIVATILSGAQSPTLFGQAKDVFEKHYSGVTRIFEDKTGGEFK